MGAAANFSELWHASTTNWRRRASAKHSHPLNPCKAPSVAGGVLPSRRRWELLALCERSPRTADAIKALFPGRPRPVSGAEKVLSRIMTPFISSTKEMNMIKATSLALASAMLISNAASAQPPPGFEARMDRKYDILRKQAEGEYQRNIAEANKLRSGSVHTAPDYTAVPKADVRQAQRTCTTTCSPCFYRGCVPSCTTVCN